MFVSASPHHFGSTTNVTTECLLPSILFLTCLPQVFLHTYFPHPSHRCISLTPSHSLLRLSPPISLCHTPSNALSLPCFLSLSLSTQLRAYRFTSFFPIWRQQLLLNALSNSERNSVVLPLSMSLALRLFTVTIHLWTYQRTSNLFLLHNCQAKLHGVCTCVCEQLEGRCESDTGATSPDVDHCLL